MHKSVKHHLPAIYLLCMWLCNAGVAQPVSYAYAHTHDANANGLLDAVNVAVNGSLPNPASTISVYLANGDSWQIDSVTTTHDSLFSVHLREDSTIENGRQTGLLPRIRFAPFPTTTQNLDTICLDGASPVISSAQLQSGDSAQPELLIILSEPVNNTSLSTSHSPAKALVLWSCDGVALNCIRQDSLLKASASYSHIGATSLTLQLVDDHRIGSSHYLSLNNDTGSGIVKDYSGNKPLPHNLPVSIAGTGQSSSGDSLEMTLSSHSFNETFDHFEDVLTLRDYSEASSWAQTEGGVLITVPVILPQDPRDKLSVVLSVFDPTGKSVYSRASASDIVPSNGLQTGWISGQQKDLYFYWNGLTNDEEPIKYGKHHLVVRAVVVPDDDEEGDYVDEFMYAAMVENPNSDSACGNCGTGVYMAFIPPVWFRFGTALRRRRSRRKSGKQ